MKRVKVTDVIWGILWAIGTLVVLVSLMGYLLEGAT